MKLRLLFLCPALLTAACAASQPSPAPTSGVPQTEEEKTAYALGAIMGQNAKPLEITAAELPFVQKGIADAITGAKLAVPLEVYGPKVNERGQAKIMAKVTTEKSRSAGFRDAAAKETGAVQTQSGLVFKTVKAGTGPSPVASDVVSVNYKGTLTDGTVFDASEKHGGPAQFKLNQVIPCWTEGVQKMKVGEKARLVCPSEIAYGDRGQPPTIPGGATLVFEVELLAVNPPAAPAKK
jgi:FKBP-type peptidyl-prolyl cis-trans isomerase FkpA